MVEYPPRRAALVCMLKQKEEPIPLPHRPPRGCPGLPPQPPSSPSLSLSLYSSLNIPSQMHFSTNNLPKPPLATVKILSTEYKPLESSKLHSWNCTLHLQSLALPVLELCMWIPSILTLSPSPALLSPKPNPTHPLFLGFTVPRRLPKAPVER